ncbi:hypothetical protein P4B35_18630 [Pontiellaceae bacterium B12227]|nr:hypothetical protein [Pontiellaceae bacterium B12227]
MMTTRSLQVLIALSLVSATSFAAKERVIRFQNHVRVGYDDNIYSTKEKTDSMFITDIVNLSAKLNFSSRTDALIYWEPEFQYRFDADPEMVTYQSLYARLNHALSSRAFLTLSDRFRYQQKEGQAGSIGGAPRDTNQNYYENDLNGAIDYTLNDVSFLKVGLGYEFRIWDDNSYGEWQDVTQTGGNDYNRFKADASYFRQLKPNKTQVMGAVNYSDLTYDGDRGGYDSITLLAGVDQNFNPQVTGFGRLGVSMSSIDQVGGSEDTTSPYVQAGLEVNPSARTSFTSSLGYSLARAENSIYNAQDQFNLGFGVRRDITAKISLSGSFNYIYSFYDSSYSTINGAPISDAKDNYLTLGLRCAYQVNRNNFLEAGYLFRTRTTTGGLSEFDGNRIDCAWRLRL